MKVRAVFIQEFYKVMGGFQIEVELEEGATIRDLIEKLDSQVYSGFKDLILEGERLRHPVEIAVNGRWIDFLDGLDTRLRDGDRILFSPRALFVV